MGKRIEFCYVCFTAINKRRENNHRNFGFKSTNSFNRIFIECYCVPGTVLSTRETITINSLLSSQG